MEAQYLFDLAISRGGEVRDRNNSGRATGPILGYVRKTPDEKKWLAYDLAEAPIGEPRETRRDALSNLYRHLK